MILLFGCVAGAGHSESSGYALYRMGQYDEAIRDWREAADIGDGGAAFQLGRVFLDGVVRERDVEAGIKWMRYAADLGDRRAQSDMGSLYERGVGSLPVSLKRAAEYYLAAARQNLPAAQYNIATMYEKGEGIGRDLVEAYKFYTLAIENDFATFAVPARDRLSYRMSRAEIELARLRARAFQEGEEFGSGGTSFR